MNLRACAPRSIRGRLQHMHRGRFVAWGPGLLSVNTKVRPHVPVLFESASLRRPIRRWLLPIMDFFFCFCKLKVVVGLLLLVTTCVISSWKAITLFLLYTSIYVWLFKQCLTTVQKKVTTINLMEEVLFVDFVWRLFPRQVNFKMFLTYHTSTFLSPIHYLISLLHRAVRLSSIICSNSIIMSNALILFDISRLISPSRCLLWNHTISLISFLLLVCCFL